MSGSDDFEEKLIEQITEMFRNMGMNLDKEQIRALMEQFRAQFENLGLDAEKIAKGDVNFNFDLSQLAKMFEKGKSMEDILQNMGIDVQVDANPIQVATPEIDEANDELYSLPADDVYLDGWNMSVTIDFTLKGDVDAAEVELSLIRGGQQLEIMKSTQTSPLARVPPIYTMRTRGACCAIAISPCPLHDAIVSSQNTPRTTTSTPRRWRVAATVGKS